MRSGVRCLALILLLSGGAARGSDWPTWRHDANRSAASEEALPDELHLQWVRKLPAARPAWPNEPRLHFDASYEPIVAGKMLFLGSPNDGSVAAYDTETGSRRWRFFTEGPVRFAPVAWQGRVCFGSDDGHLYCLDATNGSLLWRIRGAPDTRPDRRHLGNARLVSFWPVRGGPVLADGTIYFAAGIWPTLGVFVVAVDASSGKLLWRNGKASHIAKVRIDHNMLHDSGLSPQGYLVVVGDTLLVPNGRSMPAGLDRKTGKLLYYVQGYRNGDSRVTAMGRYAFVGETGVVDVRTGREVGSRWAAAGKDAPRTFVTRKFDLFEGPIFPYKLFAGCDFRSVLAPGVAYGSHRGTFYAYDLAHTTVSEYEKTHAGHKLKPWRWDAPRRWQLATEHAKQRRSSEALIKAGNRLYGHAGKTLLAVELPAPGAQPKVVWKQDIDGTPSAMLAAGGKLFVATREGAICCFGARRAKPTVHALEAAALPKARDRWTQTAADILKATGVSEGYCLVLGIGTGRLVEELLEQSRLKIIGVDADAARIGALREKLIAAGVYGTRAEVFVGKPFEFPFPPCLASLVVSEEPSAAGFSTRRPAGGLFGILRPYGGVACFALPAGDDAAFRDWVRAAGLAGAQVQRAGSHVLLRRAGALPGSASWTHECADAARSYCSKDRLVKPPLGILWYGDGPDYGFWKHKDYGIGVKPQVVGGRLFAIQLCTRTLLAYDVYTGRVLWKRRVAPFARYASMGDGIYVAGEDCCTVCDPATGVERASFRYQAGDEAGRKPLVADIRVSGDVILIAAAFEKVRVIEKGLWDSTVLVALDRETGRQLWSRKATLRFNNHAVAVGGGTVFCVDSASPIESAKAKLRGKTPQTLPSDILALDARTGEVQWHAQTVNRYRTYGIGGWVGMRTHDDWLACCEPLGVVLTGKHGQGYAFDAKSGQPLWKQRIPGGQPLILRDDTFITQSGHVCDTRTGKVVSKGGLFARGGCNYAVASQHLALVRDRSVCYVDLASERKHYLRNIRSGCSNSLVAADGLLNCPSFSVRCVCNYPIQTSFAMVHMPEAGKWAAAEAVKLPDRATARPE